MVRNRACVDQPCQHKETNENHLQSKIRRTDPASSLPCQTNMAHSQGPANHKKKCYKCAEKIERNNIGPLKTRNVAMPQPQSFFRARPDQPATNNLSPSDERGQD